MTKSKYAKFFVSKMLKYGLALGGSASYHNHPSQIRSKEQRDEVINALRGHYVRLLQKLHSAELIDAIFREWATAQQHHAIAAEFYGPEYALFQVFVNFFPQFSLNVLIRTTFSANPIQTFGKLLRTVPRRFHRF
jgi:hypothetical protein